MQMQLWCALAPSRAASGGVQVGAFNNFDQFTTQPAQRIFECVRSHARGPLVRAHARVNRIFGPSTPAIYGWITAHTYVCVCVSARACSLGLDRLINI